MDKLELDGLTFQVTVEHDECMREPWKECDGHGIISEWTTRDKKPGERVLFSDRSNKRYYDIQETIKIAKRDGWGPGAPHEAVERDFERMCAWCNDEWYYVSVIVHLLDSDGRKVPGYSAACGGIESDDTDGIKEITKELAEEIASRVGESDVITLRVRSKTLDSSNNK